MAIGVVYGLELVEVADKHRKMPSRGRKFQHSVRGRDKRTACEQAGQRIDSRQRNQLGLHRRDAFGEARSPGAELFPAPESNT